MYSPSPRILLVLTHKPSPVGHGGNHRSYQIIQDLQAACPSTELVTLTLEQLTAHNKQGYGWKDYIYQLAMRVRLLYQLVRWGGSPYRLLGYLIKSFADYNHFMIYDLAIYQQLVDQEPRFDLCLMDHTMFFDIARLNHQRGIPTWICPQNLETFDLYALPAQRDKNLIPFSLGFQQELNTMQSCEERLVISKMEAWFWDGLDLPARYYPYLPAGELREELLSIRQERVFGTIQTGLFVLLGSSLHATTGHGISWFLNQAHANGLPEGARVVIVGSGTQDFKAHFQGIPNVEFLGWVEQSQLYELLITAQAVLAPQLTGFGTLTRLSELSCAGIPIIASAHAAQAVDSPPGVVSLSNEWACWYHEISRVMQNKIEIPGWQAYQEWETNQPNPLKELINKYVK